MGCSVEETAQIIQHLAEFVESCLREVTPNPLIKQGPSQNALGGPCRLVGDLPVGGALAAVPPAGTKAAPIFPERTVPSLEMVVMVSDRVT